jgi:hypothetical protein
LTNCAWQSSLERATDFNGHDYGGASIGAAAAESGGNSTVNDLIIENSSVTAFAVGNAAAIWLLAFGKKQDAIPETSTRDATVYIEERSEGFPS